MFVSVAQVSGVGLHVGAIVRAGVGCIGGGMCVERMVGLFVVLPAIVRCSPHSSCHIEVMALSSSGGAA